MKRSGEQVGFFPCFEWTVVDLLLGAGGNFAFVRRYLFKEESARSHPMSIKITTAFQGQVGVDQRSADCEENNHNECNELIVTRGEGF